MKRPSKQEIFLKAKTNADYGRIQVKVSPDVYVDYLTKLTPHDRQMVRESLTIHVENVIEKRIMKRWSEDNA